MSSGKYTIQTVNVLSQGEQIAWVQTVNGGYVVGSIPPAFSDAREAGILSKADTIDEAEKWFKKNYGN